MHRLSNAEIALVFYDIAGYLAMEDEPFRPRAYEKAAEAIEASPEEMTDIYREGGIKALKEVPGVGESIAEKIGELLKTGRLAYHEKLKKKMPVKVAELRAVEGIGPKHVKALYEKLGITNLSELKKAAAAGKIAKLEGFGKKSEANILQGVAFVKSSGGRMLFGHAVPLAEVIIGRLEKIKGVTRIQVAGSFRRRKETIGDLDILATADDPSRVMAQFTAMPEVMKVYARGATKSSVRLQSGIDADIRLISEKSWGAALNYFTGAKDHNIALRKIAIKKGYTLSEYGLFKGKRQVAGTTEEDLYRQLGMAYIPPELREMRGEIEAALRQAQGKQPGLPELIGYDDMRGDLQIQTDWTDGKHSIEEVVKAAIVKGLSYIAITDHTKRLAMAHGLDEKRLYKQLAEIDRLNKKYKGKLVILKGTECDILKDGSLDLPDRALAKLDVVGVSVHSHFGLSENEQTARVLKAMRNPHADILFHPTGRLIQKRKAIALDMKEVIATAKKEKMVLEANASPDRLDLNDEHIRMCVEAGVKLAINSDAHTKENVGVLAFGIAQARRGWAEKSDIINAHPLEKMRKMLK